MEPSIEIVLPQFEERDIHFEQDYSESVPTCLCDRNLIRIVLINLLGNAVKYGNESGRIRLTIAPEESELRVSVGMRAPGLRSGTEVKLFPKVFPPAGVGIDVALKGDWPGTVHIVEDHPASWGAHHGALPAGTVGRIYDSYSALAWSSLSWAELSWTG